MAGFGEALVLHILLCCLCGGEQTPWPCWAIRGGKSQGYTSGFWGEDLDSITGGCSHPAAPSPPRSIPARVLYPAMLKHAGVWAAITSSCLWCWHDPASALRSWSAAAPFPGRADQARYRLRAGAELSSDSEGQPFLCAGAAALISRDQSSRDCGLFPYSHLSET